jgi:flagellin-like hook-associated protein FlgL
MSRTTSTSNSAMIVYDNYTVNRETGNKSVAISAIACSSGGAVYGLNTDGQGNIFVKVVNTSGSSVSYELYKDSSLSKESLIGTGVSGSASVERNNSGISLTLTLSSSVNYGDVFRVSMGNIILSANNACATGSAACLFNIGNSTMSGVQLGVNTDSAGKVYLKVVYDSTGAAGQVYAYNNALMREKDMVAMTMSNSSVDLDNSGQIILDSIWNDEHTANTGLGIALMIGDDASSVTGDEKANTTETMEIQFLNLGARISTAEYGSDQFIRVQTFEGGIFVDYEDAASYDSAKLLERNTTYEKRGQDATITVNGQQMKTNGLSLDLATPDIMADVIFNSGKSGTTTLAQVGYNEGSIFTKATSLTLAYDHNGSDEGSNSSSNGGFTGLLNNANHVTNETISNFQGGMQLQLGEGSGDQERTVISLKSMSTAQLGRIEVTKQFDPNKAVVETRTLSIQDVMGGQLASLSVDPSLAMTIIEKAISDVSEQRATIGAVQANMLQTNENNLRVAIENITKTESNIRDTDMASEMTEFVKNQVLANAGLSMVTQANNQAQQVMALLQ